MKIFDSHFHIIDPKYPLIENNNYLPPPFEIDDYKTQTDSLNIAGGVVVSGSFQGFYNQYLIDALTKLGKNFYGVANIPDNYKKEDLNRADAAGVTSARFNLRRGGSEVAETMVPLSNQLFDDYGWHVELYVDSRHLSELSSRLKEIPIFTIDHLGLSKGGLSELYQWVEKGTKVKATGFGRIDFDPLPVLKKIHEINPAALMFGTDLPSTRAARPFSLNDVKLIRENFSEKDQQKIFYKNAFDLYHK